MELTNWAPAHSDALRDHLAQGLSFSESVKAINLKFNTAYSRSAAIGRARRMGFTGPDRPKTLPCAAPPRSDRLGGLRSHEFRPSGFHRPKPVFEPAQSVKLPVKLRCAEVEPRHLSLVELEQGDCRYPYGGDEDGEAITFCGHPRRPDASYCTPHFHLSRNPGVPSERAASDFLLWIVETA
jgi:GcrA cell cycle regulator